MIVNRDPKARGPFTAFAEVAEELASRLWLLIASPRLDDMVMSKEHLGLIRAHVTEGDG